MLHFTSRRECKWVFCSEAETGLQMLGVTVLEDDSLKPHLTKSVQRGMSLSKWPNPKDTLIFCNVYSNEDISQVDGGTTCSHLLLGVEVEVLALVVRLDVSPRPRCIRVFSERLWCYLWIYFLVFL